MYKSPLIFQLFGAASVQVRLLFEGGIYAQFWVCKSRVKAVWHDKTCTVNAKLHFVNVTKLFENVNKHFGMQKVVEFTPQRTILGRHFQAAASTTLDKKKEPSSRFAARRTLWYHARSGAISARKKSRTVADRTCPALIAPDRAWYHTWNSVLPAANLDDGSFCLARVVFECGLCATWVWRKCDFHLSAASNQVWLLYTTLRKACSLGFSIKIACPSELHDVAYTCWFVLKTFDLSVKSCPGRELECLTTCVIHASVLLLQRESQTATYFSIRKTPHTVR